MTTRTFSTQALGAGHFAPSAGLLSTAPTGTATESMPAVLYVCASPMPATGIGAARALEEGQAYAEREGLHIVRTVEDPYGELCPRERPGWAQVREMAEEGKVAAVLVRWPNALSPEPTLRPPELDYLGTHGVSVFYTYALLPFRADGAAR